MNPVTRRYFILRYFILGGLATIAATGGYAWRLAHRFGALPATDPDSPHWHNGSFHNLEDNYVNEYLSQEPDESWGWLKFLFSREGRRYPPNPVAATRSDLASLCDGEFVWLGHSSFLVRLSGKLICIDPVLSSRVSPLPFTVPAWPGSSPYTATDFPAIDYLCITHDHWDHLDYEAATSLKYRQILCGKGVGAHFAAWGLPAPREMDWFESWSDGPLRFTFTPSRHFSGRGLTRNKSLWGGFAISSGGGGAVYFTGDGGFGAHFAHIGQRYGPFDMVFPDSGQYNRSWPTVHMFPEEAVHAVRAARGHGACPAHWGKFTLAWHPWDEPPKRFAKRAQEVGVKYILPLIGERRNIALR